MHLYIICLRLCATLVRDRRAANPYHRVSASIAIQLLKKIKRSEDKQAGLLHKFIHDDKGRRKKLDDVIRQLTELSG